MLTYVLAFLGIIFTAVIGPLIVAERRALWSLWQARRDARKLREELKRERKRAFKRQRTEMLKAVEGVPYLNTSLDLYTPNSIQDHEPFIRLPFRRQWIARIMGLLDRLPIWGPDIVVKQVSEEEYERQLVEHSQRFLQARTFLGLSPQQLARKFGMSEDAVRKFEEAEERIPVEIWKALRVLVKAEQARQEKTK